MSGLNGIKCKLSIAKTFENLALIKKIIFESVGICIKLQMFPKIDTKRNEFTGVVVGTCK